MRSSRIDPALEPARGWRGLKRILIGVSLALFGLGGRARADGSSAAKERKRAFREAREKKARNRIDAESGADWKGWLNKNFPDASSAWPAAAAKSFPEVVGKERWDYVGKGDIDRDGSPTGLLIRFEAKPKQGYLVVSRLVIAKWLDGRWTRLLSADEERGIAVNGIKPGAMQSRDFHGYQLTLFAGDPDDTQNPGMWTILEAVDRKGETLTEPADFYYAPKAKRYGGSSY